MALASLPNEIKLLISDQLDLGSAIQLKHTNHWFNNKVKPTWNQLEEWYLNLEPYRIYCIEPKSLLRTFHHHTFPGQKGPKGFQGPRGFITPTLKNKQKERMHRRIRLAKLKETNTLNPDIIKHKLRIVNHHPVDIRIANTIYQISQNDATMSTCSKIFGLFVCVVLLVALVKCG